MKTTAHALARILALALALALLALTLLLSSCDIENAFSSGNSSHLDTEGVAIKHVDYNGDQIEITYVDGYKHTVTVDELALIYSSMMLNFTHKFEENTMHTNGSEGGGDEKTTDKFYDYEDSGSDKDQDGKENATVSDDGVVIEVTTKEPSFSFVGGIGSASGISELSVYAVNAPHYSYSNGEVSKTVMFTTGQTVAIHLNGKLYAQHNAEILEYVRANLKEVTIAAEQMIQVFIGDGSQIGDAKDDLVSSLTPSATPVTKIRSGAFAELPLLERVTIPTPIKSIGVGAFYGSPALVEVIYEGTTEEWVAIEKEEGWDAGATAFTVRCTNGDIICGQAEAK
jgi:hypothetical protein